MKEHTDRKKSISNYRGPRSERIKSEDDSNLESRYGQDKSEKPETELQVPDIRSIQRELLPEPDEEDAEHGRRIKVESIGKTLGRNRVRTSEEGENKRTHKAGRNDRADFGKSRKKSESRFKSKKRKRERTVISGYERKKTEAKFSGKTDEKQYELSEELKRLYESSEFENEPVKEDDDRKKVFFNSRRSNYSGTRAERLVEKSKRIEIEDRFQDVVPFIPEKETEVVYRKRRWGRIGIFFCAFMLIFEIIIISTVTLNPDLVGNMGSRFSEIKEELSEKFKPKESPAETEAEETYESEVTETELTDNTGGLTAYVNESGAIAVKDPAIPVEAEAIGKGDSEPVELLFAGDVYLSDHVMEAYRSAGDISGVLSEGYRQEIDSVDYFVANEEFPFSTRGKQAENKQFTFRVSPDNVSLLKEMGIDLVTLANNHTLDYGTEALLDTISTLDDAGIRHVGAGSDLSSAAESVTVSIKGKKIAFIGATRVIPEPYWAAAESGTGVFAAYDDTALIEKIKSAREQADFVVVYVHWGEERKENPNEVQKTLAHDIVDAGADLVIGAHPHVLQGIEYYNGVPIVYSLGNFVFGSSIPSTALLRVTIDDAEEAEGDTTGSAVPEEAGDSNPSDEKTSVEKAFDVQLKLIPGKSSAGYTEKLDSAADIAGVYSYITGISEGVSIDGNGVVHQNS
ncbi:CapA family protein [Oribacterium sp. P6A1]|uniref:CapA family protein n=1 Tax=Oribacterium sp. P6A1 TaxID=1410612 RepID=UPI00068A6C14|nr:CapA family protein [Oribacterium sp. P6A1]